MAEHPSHPEDTPEAHAIDAVCDRFEAEWNAGRRLRIEECLQEQPEPRRAHCFHALLIIEIQLRRRDGEEPQPAEYSARFPDFTDLVDLAFREAEVTDRPEPPRQRFPIRLNCPHCHNPIAIIEGDAQDEVICPSCGSSFRLDPDRTVTWDPQKLPKLDKFELLEPVGRGAFGTVYRAHDTQLDRTVAVKVPRSGTFATQQDEDRFVREGRSAAQLHHPGIVTVYEVGRGEAFPYIVSEFVEGVTLAEMLDSRTGRKFTFRESVELVALIADALQHAHDKGVVHRDLKPSNILLQKVSGGAASRQTRDSAANSPLAAHQTPLTLQYAPRLMDFGLARRDEREITMTIEGQVLGTPAYMSTEQARGFGHQADGRTDIYSLGVTLYKLLTDELPFQGTAHMVRHQHIHDEPRPPRQLNNRIPRDLETICLKCMEKEPSRRYSSAHDLAAELRRWLDGQPIQARPVSRLERSWRWCKRKPVLAAMTAAIAFVLVVGILVSSYFAVRAGKEADRATAEATKAINEKKRADSQAEDARRNLYIAHMNIAQNAWEGARVGAVLDLLDRYRESDLRGFEWFFLNRRCHSDWLTLKGHSSNVRSVAFSPHERRLASGSDDKTLKVWDAASGREILTLKGHAAEVNSVAFSPDGRRLASGSDDKTLKVWDAASGREILTLDGHTGVVTSVVFSPDGLRLASGSVDNTVKVWDPASGQEVMTLRGHTGWVRSVAFSADGSRLASGSDDGTVKVWDATSGQEIVTLKGHTGVVWSTAFSPDGKWLASGSLDQTVKVWDAASGQESLTLRGHTGWVRSVAFSPDAKRLVSSSDDSTIKVWDAANGQETLTLKGHTGYVFSVAFSPDGHWLASGSYDRTIKVWGTMSGQATLSLRGHTTYVRSVAFGLDGSQLASGSDDGTVKLWDAASGQEIVTFKGHGGWVRSVAFGPGAKRLASGSADGTVKVWDVVSGQESLTLVKHAGVVWTVAFSPDGTRLASGSDDSTVQVWDAASGQEILTLKGHNGRVESVAFSPDGRWLASCSDDSTVKLWDAASGQETRTLQGHTGRVWSVAFSPDGRRLASGSDDNTVKVWDAASGQEALTLKGHTGYVLSVAFSPDGRRLASGSDDNTVKVWDLAGAQETLTLKGHTNGVTSVAFSPDGKRLASASGDQTVTVWDARPWTPELRAEQEVRSLLPLLANGLFKQEVVDAIAADASLSDGVRSRALELARNAQEDPNALNEASWLVVRQPNRPTAEYARALLQAEAACRIQPDYGPFLNTLGVAQYRNGKYDDALQTLTRSNEINSRDPVGVQPADVAFLSMTHHQLGRTEESQKLLARLRQLLQASRWKTDPDSQRFLREAESLIESPPAQPPPPPLPQPIQ